MGIFGSFKLSDGRLILDLSVFFSYRLCFSVVVVVLISVAVEVMLVSGQTLNI